MSWPFRKDKNPDLRRHESGFGKLIKTSDSGIISPTYWGFATNI